MLCLRSALRACASPLHAPTLFESSLRAPTDSRFAAPRSIRNTKNQRSALQPLFPSALRAPAPPLALPRGATRRTIHAFFISNTFISNTRLKFIKNYADAKQHPQVGKRGNCPNMAICGCFGMKIRNMEATNEGVFSIFLSNT